MWAPGMRTIYFSEWVMLKLVQDRWTKTVEKKKLGLVLAVKRCGILRSREKEGTYTLCNSMEGTGEHYASEISHAVEEKYHRISPISGT